MSDSTQADPKRYKKTLNLPKTAFPMKANLVQNEPASIKRWDKLDVYGQLRAKRKEDNAEAFVFHDGPPYANGDIHLGHLLNKVLKDLVVRSQNMLGKDCPYTPGWDCHGLPIEHKVMQDLGEKAREMEPIAIRRKCAKYAEKFVKTQKGQMQRLLTMADYGDPYLTMLPRYERGVIEVFAGLVEKGLVYRDLKPVHWSIENQTALAEAELEYYDREDTSVFVKFEIDNPGVLPDSLNAPSGERIDLLIWTTTPWTLPANMAVAASSANFLYCLYEYQSVSGSTEYVLLNDNLAEGLGSCSSVFAAAGINTYQNLGATSGVELNKVGVRYKHPFIDRTSPVVTAMYVTADDGTGLVHTAPGHGVEDYQTGRMNGIRFDNGNTICRDQNQAVDGVFDVYCPVLADGTFDDTVPDWLQCKHVFKANEEVVDHLRDSGHLFHANKFMHSYPHDWRGKTPIIFRATEQWFVGVDKAFDCVAGDAKRPVSLRKAAMNEAENNIHFLPDWGKNRLRGMLESRPDWCISRQRSWGLPIPAFYPPKGVEGEPLLTTASVKAVAQAFGKHGSDAWFVAPPESLLEAYDAAADPDAPGWAESADLSKLVRGKDTFDVWFESGSSWNAVMKSEHGWGDKQSGAKHPADLYLEGSDQHRGWFQHSLLPSVAIHGVSPFKTVLTHGFMVDKHGKKMSKSDGNALKVEELMKTFGADVARWWVCSLNTDNDIKVDLGFFKLAGEEYRKVRNTLRFLLSNLEGFDPKQDAHEFTDADATSIDAWAMGEYVKLADAVKGAYAGFHYRSLSRLLFNFCNDTLSAVYLFGVKDRLYCDASNSPRRKRTQTAIYRIASGLIRLLGPICPHSADEAWRALHGVDNKSGLCVHTETFPSLTGCSAIPVSGEWSAVMALRDQVMKALEAERNTLGVDNPLDLGVSAPAPQGADVSSFDTADLADLCGVSRFAFEGDAITVADLREQPACERSWKRDGTVKARSDGGVLSDRDAAALGLD
ncbi:MAG: isoleucine--tRNA ligase [Phycisphaeraceae bacterium]|nr:isoleucine--tRNA ligase [Phycisphaeraceae bacterium]